MKTNKSVNPTNLALLFATPLGCSIWVASNNIAIGIGLSVVIIGVYLSIVRGDWMKSDKTDGKHN
jgi:hypothetical protein